MLEFLELTWDEPSEFHRGGEELFAVIPTSTVVRFDKMKVKLKSYLLGISRDDGVKWKFVDGAGMTDVERRKKLLPNLPESLKLPAAAVSEPVE
jgi:hypothetical protein